MRRSSSCRLRRSLRKHETNQPWALKSSRLMKPGKFNSYLGGASWPGAHGRHPPFHSQASRGLLAYFSPLAASAASPFHPETSSAWSTRIQKYPGEQNGEVPLALYRLHLQHVLKVLRAWMIINNSNCVLLTLDIWDSSVPVSQGDHLHHHTAPGAQQQRDGGT